MKKAKIIKRPEKRLRYKEVTAMTVAFAFLYIGVAIAKSEPKTITITRESSAPSEQPKQSIDEPDSLEAPDPCELKVVVCEGEEPLYKKGEFSAYTASEDETDGDPYIAANNKKVFIRGIACPRKYAFGQKIEIKGYGVYECNDRMNQRYREKENFDIYMTTKTVAFDFGRRNLEYREL
jgi:3D (Asp-Asp-Asp) domain-containing protein